MTRKSLFNLFVCLLLVLVVSSCDFSNEPEKTQLTSPKITLSENIINWEAVEHADSYDIYVDSQLKTNTTSTTYTIEVDEAGVYKLYVIAKSSDQSYLDSEKSNEVEYTHQVKLNAPVLNITGTLVTWTDVANATGYEVYFDGELLETVETTSKEFSQTGEHSIYVVAISSNPLYLTSDNSNTVSLVNKIKLGSPVVALSNSTVSWEEVDSASEYEVYVNDELKATVSACEYTIVETLVGTYEVKVRAKGDNVNTENGEFSNVVSYVVNPTKLASPVVSLNDNVVLWVAVDNADSYEVYVNGQVVTNTTSLSYTVIESAIGIYSVKVKALSSSAQFSTSDLSNEVSYTVRGKLVTPSLTNNYNLVEWTAIANAVSYNVYVDGNLAINTESLSYILPTAAGNASVQVEAVGSGLYDNSDKSAELDVHMGSYVSQSVAVAGETFDSYLEIGGDEFLIVEVNNDYTAHVWLRYFVKSNIPTEYRVLAVEESGVVVVLDWNTIGGVKVDKQNLANNVSGQTAVGYEYVAIKLELLEIELDGSYTFIIENRTAGSNLNITNFDATEMLSDKYSMKYTPNEYGFADDVAVGTFGLEESDPGTVPYYYSNFVPYGEMKVFWGSWVTFDYTNIEDPATKNPLNVTNINSDGKYQAMSRMVTFNPLGDNDAYTLWLYYGNEANVESNMLWKFTAYDPETGKTYILSDWFVWIGELAGENQTTFILDKEASEAISGKTVLFTIQCQPQDGVNGASVGLNNRMFIRNYGFKTYSAPKESGVWTVENPTDTSYFSKEEITKINSDSFNGKIVLSGLSNKATATYTIDSSWNNSVWLTFFAKAKSATVETSVPSTMFKLSMVIDGTTYTLLDWSKIGGTTSDVKGTIIANDDYEIFFVNLDNFIFDYAGKEVEFILEQKDSGDGSEQELSVVGFELTQKQAIIGNSSPYAGMTSWVTNYTEWVEWQDMPLPGGWLRAGACVGEDYKYQGIATTVTMPTVSAGQTVNFEFVFSNYGNYTSMIHKLIAIDDEGHVYTLIDWNFFDGPGGDTLKSYTIDAEVAAALSGKTNVTLIWQFNDSQNIDSPFNNRMYITNMNFVIQ